MAFTVKFAPTAAGAVTGNLAIPNGSHGVMISGNAFGNTIGPDNIISANTGLTTDGIFITGSVMSPTLIELKNLAIKSGVKPACWRVLSLANPMSPPLIVEKSHIDDMVSILGDAIKRVA